jgi:D-tyrosyl-tRNA(Tyr) deacylase
MITIIQRVTEASVTVDGKVIGIVNKGILALVAVEKQDTTAIAERLLERILNYRIFADVEDKMNLSLRDIEGSLLIVPQFTLAANTDKGNRPSFASAAPPEFGREMFAYLQKHAIQTFEKVQFGEFGADMKVALINDGPVTFTLKI